MVEWGPSHARFGSHQEPTSLHIYSRLPVISFCTSESQSLSQNATGMIEMMSRLPSICPEQSTRRSLPNVSFKGINLRLVSKSPRRYLNRGIILDKVPYGVAGSTTLQQPCTLYSLVPGFRHHSPISNFDFCPRLSGSGRSILNSQSATLQYAASRSCDLKLCSLCIGPTTR